MTILNTGLLYVAAVTQSAEGTAAQAIQTYPFVALSIITGFGIIIVWFVLRTVKQIDNNQARMTLLQDKLFTKLDDLCEDYYTLKGEHRALACSNRRKDDPKEC